MDLIGKITKIKSRTFLLEDSKGQETEIQECDDSAMAGSTKLSDLFVGQTVIVMASSSNLSCGYLSEPDGILQVEAVTLATNGCYPINQQRARPSPVPEEWGD